LLSLDLEDNCIIAKSEYNPTIIAVIKSFKRAQWDSYNRIWRIPLEFNDIQAVHSKLVTFGPICSDRVILKIKEYQENQLAKETMVSKFSEQFQDSQLKEFQKIGIVESLKKGSFLIADSMGLGKSASAIHVAYIRNQTLNEKIIIICPSSLKNQWEREINKWIPNQDIQIIEGSKNTRTSQWSNLKIWDICSFECFRVDKPNVSKCFLIIDEASKLKNPNAIISKTVAAKRQEVSDVLLLTGTPLENNLQDFWNILSIIKPNWLSKQEFFSTFVIWDEIWAGATRGNIHTITGYKNFEAFRNRAKDMFIRRRKEEVTDLLPKNYELRQIDFTHEQKLIEHQLIEKVKESENENMVLGLLQLLRVNASDPRALELSSSEFAHGISVSKPSNKINEIRDICNETDCKIIVFTQFARVAELIAADLKEYKPFIITGEDKDKDSIIQQFKADKDRRLLITTDTLAYGHSIDEADILIHYDTPYGLGKIMQREDRIHRMDSTRAKTIIYLFSGEVENHVGVLVRNKLEMYSKVVDGENDNAIVSSIFRYIRDK